MKLGTRQIKSILLASLPSAIYAGASRLMPGHRHNKVFTALRRVAGSSKTGAAASGASALGALAVGALAIGALAVGRLAIHRLAIGKSHLRSLEIDELKAPHRS